MNAIIGMCHFCEQHGPRVLFCTQPIHDSEPLQTLMSNPPSSDFESCASSSIDPETLHPPTRASSWPLKYRPMSSMASNSSVDGACDMETTSKERCEGCRSRQADQPGFISRDNEAQIRYVSSQQPHQNDVYRVLRQACIRSLSSEVCPGREGPIFFGDSNTQYILSYTFHLRDTKSRGGRRLYSIIVVMMDRIYLLNSWPFLVKHIRNIVTELQAKSDKVFTSEDNGLPRVQLSKERGYTQPTQTRLQRTKGSAVRAMTDITGDADLFKMLHLAFTWILKACGTRLTEKLLEGPPTEDSIVDLEKKEVITDDGFVLVPTEKVKPMTRTISESSQTSGAVSAVSGMLAGSCTITDDSFENSASHCTFHNLRDLYQVIGYRQFHQLAHHVIIGNQVIVQADSLQITKSIIDCLQVLLPRGCCRVIYSSDVYQESFKCNFLGLSKFTCIPDHVIENDTYVLVLVEDKSSDRFQTLTCNPLEMYPIQIHTNRAPFDRLSAPAMLEKMERAMANLKLSWRVVEQAITIIKEEWMNKVKVLYTFTKAGGSRSEDETRKLFQVLGATQEDKPALKFWMTGLSHQYKNHMRTTVNKI